MILSSWRWRFHSCNMIWEWKDVSKTCWLNNSFRPHYIILGTTEYSSLFVFLFYSSNDIQFCRNSSRSWSNLARISEPQTTWICVRLENKHDKHCLSFSSLTPLRPHWFSWFVLLYPTHTSQLFSHCFVLFRLVTIRLTCPVLHPILPCSHTLRSGVHFKFLISIRVHKTYNLHTNCLCP